MNIVVKSLVASAVALALSGVALAEESGAFAGVELGAGVDKVHLKFNAYDTDGSGEESGSSNSKNVLGAQYGIKGGYKYFITNDFGVRGYAYFNYKRLTYKWSTSEDGLKSPDAKASALRYGIGADALYNFMDGFGVFAGASLGNNAYTIKIEEDGWKLSKSGLDVAINLGAIATLEKTHSIELGVSVPVVNPKLKKSNEFGSATFTPKTAAALKISYLFNF